MRQFKRVRSSHEVTSLILWPARSASASGSILYRSGMNKKIGRNLELFTPCSAASPPAPVFDLRAHFCHSAPMETVDSGAMPRKAEKRFPISISRIASVGLKQLQGGRREPAIHARQCACGGICPRCHTPPNAQSLLDAIGDEGMGPEARASRSFVGGPAVQSVSTSVFRTELRSGPRPGTTASRR